MKWLMKINDNDEFINNINKYVVIRADEELSIRW